MKAFTCVLLLACGLLLAAPARGLATSWETDPEASRLGFSVEVQGKALTGAFASFETRIDFDPDNPGAGRIEADINVASLTMGNSQADSTAKSTAWLDVAEFATARFQSLSIKAVASNDYVVEGQLTIKAVTLPITLTFQLTEDDGAAQARGRAELSRGAFDVGLPLSELIPVGDVVTVTFSIVAKPL